MTDLRQWLDGIGLSQYADVFAQNEVDYDVLRELTEQDLEKLGIPLGHRKKLLRAMPWQPVAGPRALPREDDATYAAKIGAERRHLTVLFCDLVDSTALSARLDPEDLRQILHGFQSCCGESIRRYEGHIARFMGDGVLAYFGFPVAHEDDAERAVSTALELVQSVSRLAGPRAPLAVRVGIASGLVIVGDLIGVGSSREFALIGEAPNLAARLQSLAEPNQILIAPQTWRLIGRTFELSDLGEHAIKGLDHPVRVWRVLRSSPIESRFEARQSSQATPLVNREAEMAVLLDRYRKAKRGQGQVILIPGEPGMGKSRLAVALRGQVADSAFCPPVFQCSSYHISSAWHPIIHHLELAAGIDPEMSSALKLDKLEWFVSQVDENAASIVPLLAALLSIPTDGRYPALELTPQQQKQETFAAVLALLRSYARRRTALLVFEDVHWFDPTSLELLGHVVRAAREWPTLILVLLRPELTLPWTEHSHVSSLSINRLSRDHAQAMIGSVSDRAALPPAVIDQILARTDGVPLFIEEMTKAVIEAAERAAGEGPLPAEDARLIITVPDTLHASLMARIDQLNPVKTVAQIAAVIGREFSLKLVETIAPLPKDQVHAAMDRLIASGLVFRSGHLRSQYFTFKHALVQDEAYASLLRDRRRELHGAVAEALCASFTEIAEASPELVARHFTEAGRLRPAIDFWLRAGRRASERSAFVEATVHLRTALKLLETLPANTERDALELELQHALGSAFIAVKGFGATETSAAFSRALELCGRFKESPQSFAMLNSVIGVQLVRGEFEQARDLAQDLLTRASRQDDSTPILMGHRALGTALFLLGQLAGARDHLQSALDVYNIDRHGPLRLIFSQDYKSTAQAYLGLTCVLLGDIDAGLAHGRDAVAHAEQLHHPHSICYVLPFLAGAHIFCGEAQAAYPVAERTIALSGKYGFPLWLAGGHMLRGWARLDLGDVERGLDEIHQSMAALEATGALTWVEFARYLLAQGLERAGQRQQALDLIDRSLEAVRGTGGRWYEAELHRLRGDVLRESAGSLADVEICYRTAIDISACQGAKLWQLRAANALASLWRAHGKISAGRALVGPLCAAFKDYASNADVQRARILIGEPNSTAC
jgi:class 3 adenylate cyclase/predicted ATPase